MYEVQFDIDSEKSHVLYDDLTIEKEESKNLQPKKGFSLLANALNLVPTAAPVNSDTDFVIEQEGKNLIFFCFTYSRYKLYKPQISLF